MRLGLSALQSDSRTKFVRVLCHFLLLISHTSERRSKRTLVTSSRGEKDPFVTFFSSVVTYYRLTMSFWFVNNVRMLISNSTFVGVRRYHYATCVRPTDVTIHQCTGGNNPVSYLSYVSQFTSYEGSGLSWNHIYVHIYQSSIYLVILSEMLTAK